MARDYAKISTKAKKKPQSRRNSKKSGREGRLWILTLVLAGLFILGLVYLKNESVKLSVATSAGGVLKPALVPVVKSASLQPRFDFDAAPATGVKPQPAAETRQPMAAKPNLPTKIESMQTPSPVAASSSSTKREDATTPESATTDPVAEVAALAKQQLDSQSQPPAQTVDNPSLQPKAYIVQFGLLKHFVDADALKAQLVLQGLEVKITILKKGGVTLYQVASGPFKTQQAAEKLRQDLEANQINSEIIKQ